MGDDPIALVACLDDIGHPYLTVLGLPVPLLGHPLFLGLGRLRSVAAGLGRLTGVGFALSRLRGR